MSYRKTIIYFTSGTGNSYRVAKWAEQIANKKNAKASVITIEDANPRKEIDDRSDTIVGFIMPTHGFTAPWHMIRFLWRLPSRKATHAFCIATRAGVKIGSMFMPGLSASATFITSIMLSLKGYKIRGFRGIDMPSNWTACHPGFTPKAAEAIISNSKVKAVQFIEDILSGKKRIINGSNLYDLIFAIILLPISIAFTFLGRFFLGKLFFANNKCDGCGICADNCAVGAIAMRGSKNPRPYWRYNCENCMRCMAFCPKEAVEAGHSWGVVLYFVTTIPISAYLISLMGGSLPGIPNPQGHWINDIIQLIYLYPAIFVSYFFFHFLMRVPFINTLFTYTTLTHVYRRYHEPDTKLKDIAPKGR